MIRVLIAALIIGAAVFGAWWLLDNPGTVSVEWLDTTVTLSFAMAVVGLVVIVVASALLLALVWALIRAPARLSAYNERRRREKGYRALTLGMVAVAAGDAGEARRQAHRAEGLLDEPPLNMLLSAQSAQLEGDEDAARRYFTGLMERPDTAFLGLRGLYMQASRGGRTLEALEYVEKADAARPGTAWVLEALFLLRCRASRWEEAGEALDRLAKKRSLPKEKLSRWRAVVDVERSRAADGAGNLDRAVDLARSAWKSDTALTPAAAQLALMHVRNNRKSRAEKVIAQAWEAEPHPSLMVAYRRVVETVNEKKRLTLVKKMTAPQENHPETRMAIAEFALAAKDWDEARTALAPLLRSEASVRICRLMADLELASTGDVAAARDWLARATIANPDPAWVCRESGAVQADWTAVCLESGEFDSLEWRPPNHLPTPVLEHKLKAELETLLHSVPGEERGRGQAVTIEQRGSAATTIEPEPVGGTPDIETAPPTPDHDVTETSSDPGPEEKKAHAG